MKGPNKLTYYEALTYCEADGTLLVEINSKEEQKQIAKFLKYYEEVWIGLSDRQNEGSFVWESTGNKPNYTKWRSGILQW